MRCKVCGHDGLVEAEYRTGRIAAPALECEACQAIDLDESVAESSEERESVRRALAARHTAGAPFESGSHRTSEALSPAEVDAVVSEVDLVLAEARVALEFLAQTTDGESAKAVGDVQHAVERIHGLVDDLGRRCVQAVKRAETVRPPMAGSASG